MTTRIHLGTDGTLDLATGALAPKVLSRGTGWARTALVAARALLLAGDHVVLDVTVDTGCTLDLLDVAGTVAHHGRGGPTATWTTRIHLAPRARLRWHAEPLVVADGARVERHLAVDLAPGAVAVLRETLVLGRTGERGGALRSRTRATLDGTPLLVEDLDLRDPATRSSPAVLADHRCLDTITVLGERWDHPDALQLAGPGTLLRRLHPAAHLSTLPALWASTSHPWPSRHPDRAEST